MVKTKQSFLRRLRWSLALCMPPPEAREVAEDHAGFFDEKLAEGKTEAEVCAEFGSPSRVARTILAEDGKKVWPLLLLALAAACLAWFLNWWWTLMHLGRALLFDLAVYGLRILLVPLLWWAWRGSVYPGEALRRGPFAALCAAPPVLFGAVYALISWLMHKPVEWFDQVAEGAYVTSRIGTWTATVCQWAMGTVFVLALLGMLWGWTRSPWYLVPAAHALGCYAAIAQCIETITSMDMEGLPTGTLARLLGCLAVYAVIGLGGAALTALLVWRGGRHGRAA